MTEKYLKLLIVFFPPLPFMISSNVFALIFYLLIRHCLKHLTFNYISLAILTSLVVILLTKHGFEVLQLTQIGRRCVLSNLSIVAGSREKLHE